MNSVENAAGNGKGDGTRAVIKLAYKSPSLIAYGSVRELTGSGTGGVADGGMFMA